MNVWVEKLVVPCALSVASACTVLVVDREAFSRKDAELIAKVLGDYALATQSLERNKDSAANIIEARLNVLRSIESAWYPDDDSNQLSLFIEHEQGNLDALRKAKEGEAKEIAALAANRDPESVTEQPKLDASPDAQIAPGISLQSAPEPVTEAANELTQTINTIQTDSGLPPDRVLSPRIYLQIACESQREVCRTLSRNLAEKDEGYLIPGIENTGEKGKFIPGTTEVRYYGEIERPEAAALAGYVSEHLGKAPVKTLLVRNASGVRPKTFEVWFSKDAFTQLVSPVKCE